METSLNDTGSYCREMEAALRGWLPQGAGIRCMPASVHYEISMHERARIQGAVAVRQAEFVGGRWCAHEAMRQLGKDIADLPAGPLGSPLWPDGITGSITHESGVCAAVAMPGYGFKGIGIDLFDQRRDTDMNQLCGLILHHREGECCPVSNRPLTRLKLAFSAKEAVVKAVSTTAGKFLDMRDIRLSVTDGNFDAVLDGLSLAVKGHWTVIGPYILSLALFHSFE